MTAVVVQLPDELAADPRTGALLQTEALVRWIRGQLAGRSALDDLADKLAVGEAQEPMPMDEIVAEVKAVRRERRARGA